MKNNYFLFGLDKLEIFEMKESNHLYLKLISLFNTIKQNDAKEIKDNENNIYSND